jgi:hypothetical protein
LGERTNAGPLDSSSSDGHGCRSPVDYVELETRARSTIGKANIRKTLMAKRGRGKETYCGQNILE